MENQLISYKRKNHVGYIKLNVEKIDLAAAQELERICGEIIGDNEVYLAVLTGNGGIFNRGAEIDEIINAGFPVKTPAESIASLLCPVIAAVNGDALDEGLELALACDLRISAKNAHFGLSGVAKGKMPVDGGTQRLSRIAGKAVALEMILTGEPISAARAFECGLVNKIVPENSLEEEVENITAILSQKAPFALRYAKESVNSGLDLTLEQGLKLEADLYFLLHTTGDRTEGIRAFQEKRKPEFKGN